VWEFLEEEPLVIMSKVINGMKNKFKIILFVILFALAGILFSSLIILFLKYFPLGEKTNMDFFLIFLAIASIYFIVKTIIKKIGK